MSQMELMRDVQDLDTGQLCEILEALQTKIAWGRWLYPNGVPQGNLKAPGDSGEGVPNDGELDSRLGRRWSMANSRSSQ